MKITIDTDAGQISKNTGDEIESLPLYSKAGFELISYLWVKVGWNEKYAYTFSWLGRPLIQLPEDMIRTQEVLYRVRPTLVIETGVAHGGSLIYYASLLRLLGGGRVVGVDIEIRPHNRRAIQEHELASSITLIEGDSVAPEIVQQVGSLIRPNDTVLVILDSNHTRQHVLSELEAYHPFVTRESYIVATDGIMAELHDVPRGGADWGEDHPSAAAAEFVRQHAEFILEQPNWSFNESQLTENVTHWPNAWIKRIN